MEPNLMVGDVVVAQPLNAEQKKDITKNQVLLAIDPSHPEQLVTHRVVNVLNEVGFITKGDANAKADATIVPIANVKGVERIRIPMIGVPVQQMRNGNPLLVVVVLLLALVAQIIVMRENRIQKAIISNSNPEVKVKPVPLKKIRTRTAIRKRWKIIRIASLCVTYSLVLLVTVATASSAASFSGTTANAKNAFSSTADFISAYKNRILADSPSLYYRLNELSGRTVIDSSASAVNGQYSNSGVSYNAPGALTRDTANKAVTLNGTTGVITSGSSTAGRQTLSTQIWFKTTTNRGGKLIGFAAGNMNSTGVDRVIYMSSDGKVFFGIDAATKKTISTPNSYNDGKWHRVTATLSGANASLYIDGKLVSTGTTANLPTTASGYWKMGGGTFSGWASQPTSSFFAGSLDEPAIYPTALTASQIAADYSVA